MSHGKQLLRLFLAVYAVHCFSNLYFLFGPFYEGRGATPQAAGWFLSIFYVATTLCRPLGSFALERLGVRKTLVGAAILCAAGSAGIALFLNSPPLLLAFRALTGIGFSAFVVGAMAFQSLVIPPEVRGASFALVTTGSMAPLATIVPLSDWLIQTGHPYLYLWSAPLLGTLCIVLGYLVEAPDRAPAPKPVWGSYRDLMRLPGFPVLAFSALFLALCDATTICVASLARERGVLVSSFMVANAVAAVLVRTVGFRFMDRFPRTLLAAPAFGTMAAALLGMSFSSTNGAFLVWGLLFGLGIGVGFPTYLSLIGDLAPERLHPKGTAAVLLSIDVGWTLTPLLFGYLSPGLGVSGTFRFFAVAGGAAALLAHRFLWLPLYRRNRKAACLLPED
ncbi:MFS transporter [Aminomonas paucivorans]|uniref:MFS transporter n=1 Tax=Aminomonas paucivorans TaxID=81412 RepID=UPI003329E533